MSFASDEKLKLKIRFNIRHDLIHFDLQSQVSLRVGCCNYSASYGHTQYQNTNLSNVNVQIKKENAKTSSIKNTTAQETKTTRGGKKIFF